MHWDQIAKRLPLLQRNINGFLDIGIDVLAKDWISLSGPVREKKKGGARCCCIVNVVELTRRSARVGDKHTSQYGNK